MVHVNKQHKIGIPVSDRVLMAVIYVLIGVIFFITLYPVYFVVIASISDPNAVALGQVLLWPSGLRLDSYERVFRYTSIWRAYGNTVLYTLSGTALQLTCTMVAAFVFSRKHLKGSRVCMLIILFTMYFNGGLIPTYLNIRNLGLMDSIWALILPGAINVYNLIVARTFIQSTIPDALSEAAEIDGCSPIGFFWRVVVPLSGPIIGVLTLYICVALWNSYMSALIYLRDRFKYPLQLILREILIQSKMSISDMGDAEIAEFAASQELAESLKYALVVVSSVPILILYPFLQRFFTKGIMIGSVKG